jgi:hypothetical protein
LKEILRSSSIPETNLSSNLEDATPNFSRFRCQAVDFNNETQTTERLKRKRKGEHISLIIDCLFIVIIFCEEIGGDQNHNHGKNRIPIEIAQEKYALLLRFSIRFINLDDTF